MDNRIDRIIASDFFPTYQGQEPAAYYRAIDEHVARLKRRGVTHVTINQSLVSIPMAMEPDNAYLSFAGWGPALDKFVTSTYNAGLYYEGLLAENRRLLLYNADLARKHGFRCSLFCVEPTFVMESFFKRHPALRGPRADNPSCSTAPVFTLCPMLPEVQDHYRQLVSNMLRLVPEIDEIQIFTNDSGGGICHSSHLYSGPNGPNHCRKTPPGKQAQVFAQTLAEAGRELNPNFRVVMTSGLSPAEKADFARDMPPGVASSVYGAFAWGGGMEDRWGTQEFGPGIYGNAAVRARVRQWQHDDYRARVKQIVDNGGIAYASYNYDYYAGEDPRPWETHEIACRLIGWGVTNIIGGGPGTTPWSANMAVLRHAVENGVKPTDLVVDELARKWVGADMAPALLEAWRLNEQAAREWPYPPGGHLLTWWPILRCAPIVPDDDRLGEHDLDFAKTDLGGYDRKMKDQQGWPWRLLHYADGLAPVYLKQFEHVVFPALEKAVTTLNGLLARKGLTPQQLECLQEQVASVSGFLSRSRHVYHWLAASTYRIAGMTPPPGLPSLRAIIAAEIEVYDQIDRDAGRDPAANPRTGLMRKHIDDPAKRVDLSAFTPSSHPPMENWEGAHLAK